MSRAACRKLMRVSWRTVGSICPGAEARLSEARPPVPGGLVRTGVDEASHRRGCKHMTAIVNHDTGAVLKSTPDLPIWARFLHQPGQNRSTSTGNGISRNRCLRPSSRGCLQAGPWSCRTFR